MCKVPQTNEPVQIFPHQVLPEEVVSVSEDALYTLFLAYDTTPLAGNTDFPCDFQRCSSD